MFTFALIRAIPLIRLTGSHCLSIKMAKDDKYVEGEIGFHLTFVHTTHHKHKTTKISKNQNNIQKISLSLHLGVDCHPFSNLYDAHVEKFDDWRNNG